MRREFSKRVRLEIVRRAMTDDGKIVCEGCGLVLGKKLWEIDHIIPEALVVDKARELTAKDGQLLGIDCCHRGGRRKTASDVARIAKSKRQAARHAGIRKPSRLPCGRDSKWKRTVDGRTVLR